MDNLEREIKEIESEEYFCKMCNTPITKWQHEYNDDICIFCQEQLDEEIEKEWEEQNELQ